MQSAVTGRPLSLLGGAVCLDLLNTIDPRLRPPREDFLATFAQLAQWARYVGLLSTGEERALLAAGARDPALAAHVHGRALELRDALYQLLRPDSHRAPRALEVLNREISGAAPGRVLVAERGRYRLAWRSAAAHERLLGAVAFSASDLLTSTALDRVRECAGEGCGWLFLDTSKAHRRRWCSMAVCGNRAKAQRHRRQHRTAPRRAHGELADAKAVRVADARARGGRGRGPDSITKGSFT
jgi:predicted RNA-binding Zn ribbon-like protein